MSTSMHKDRVVVPSLVSCLALFAASCQPGRGGSSATTGATASSAAVSDTVPAAGETGVATNRAVTVAFDRAMAATSIDGSSFRVTGPGSLPVAGFVSYDVVDHVATFAPSAPLAANTTFTATVTTHATSESGVPLASDRSWTFVTGSTLDTTAPKVSATAPAKSAFGVAPNRRVTATFDEPMDATTLTSSTFIVAGPGSVAVAGTVTYAGRTAVFTPSVALAHNTVYTASLTTGVEDLAGNALASKYSWSFTTGATADATAPALLARLYTSSEQNVATNSKVAVQFDEPLDPTTLTASTFQVSGPSASAVVGSVACHGDVVEFAPLAGFVPDTDFTATITTGVTDLAGNPVPGDDVWTFHSGPAGDGVAPVALAHSPASGETDVPVNATIPLQFDEMVDLASLDTSTFTLQGPGATPVAGAVRFDPASRVATFAPLANLAGNTLFTVTASRIRDLARNPLPADVVWTFTSGQQVDQRAPTVVTTTPVAGASSVATNRSVVVTFSGAMDSATIGAKTFTLSGPASSPIAGVVTADVFSATFTPSGLLAPSTTYTAKIAASVATVEGVALGADKTFTFTTGSGNDTTPPTVASTNPSNLAVGVAVNQSINATFSEPVSPQRISVASFKVHGPSGVDVAGKVSLDSTQTIATFTPSASLAANTLYTATLVKGVGDLAGNLLATDVTWTFTTDSHSLQAAVALGNSASFGAMATLSIVSSGSSQVGGDVGLAPGTSQGLPASRVNGTIHLNDAIVTGGQTDLSAAYQNLQGRAGGAALGADLANTTITPGLYKRASAVQISTGTLTLDAQGDANALFLFQVGGAFTAAANTQVVLLRGAKASNVFWQVAGTALVDTNANFKGTVLATSTVTANSGSNVDGRLFAGATGASTTLTLTGATVTAPAR